jgi:hypothetical protein
MRKKARKRWVKEESSALESACAPISGVNALPHASISLARVCVDYSRLRIE